jgi:hypothetical protein
MFISILFMKGQAMKKYLVSLSIVSLLFVNLAYASHYPRPGSVKTSNPIVWDESAGDDYCPKPADPFIVWSEDGGDD